MYYTYYTPIYAPIIHHTIKHSLTCTPSTHQHHVQCIIPLTSVIDVAPTEEELKEKKRIAAAAIVKQAEANAKIAKERKESAKGKKEGKEAANTPAAGGSGKGSKGSAKGEAKAAASSKKKSTKKSVLKPKKIRTPPSDDAEYVCLVHAKVAGTKASTLVPLKDLTKFQRQLTTVIKASGNHHISLSYDCVVNDSFIIIHVL